MMSPSPTPPAPPQLPAPTAPPPGAYPPPQAGPPPSPPPSYGYPPIGAPAQPYPAIAAPAAPAAPPQPAQYVPEPLHQPSPFWRAVKWPLRQVFKALILTGRAPKAHKVVAVLILLLVAVIGAGTIGFYRLTHPADTINVRANGGSAGGSSQSNAPFTVQLGQPPLELPDAVTNALLAFRTYDAERLWNSFDPAFQQYETSTGLTQNVWQQQFDQWKAQGVTFDQFRETGGYATTGGGYYTFTILAHQGQQGGIISLYFAVDPNGAISNFEFLHLQPQSRAGG
jgi:hypothetical protein